MPIGTIVQSDKLNTQSTVLTNNSVLVASVVNREWRWQTQQNVLNWGFNPLSAANVIDCTSSSGWGSSGWCAVLLTTGQPFQLLLIASLMPVATQWGYGNNFKNLCYNTERIRIRNLYVGGGGYFGIFFNIEISWLKWGVTCLQSVRSFKGYASKVAEGFLAFNVGLV